MTVTPERSEHLLGQSFTFAALAVGKLPFGKLRCEPLQVRLSLHELVKPLLGTLRQDKVHVRPVQRCRPLA
jgi:hypothetical protein